MDQFRDAQDRDACKAVIDAALQYISAPHDRAALGRMVKHSIRGAYGVSAEESASNRLPTVTFLMRDSRGVEHKIRCTPAFYALALIANALGHDFHINRRARDSYPYLRLVPARSPGTFKTAEVVEGSWVKRTDQRMPYNFDGQRILFGAGQKEKVHTKSEDRLNLTYENWELKGGAAKTDEVSLHIALLIHPRGWVSPFSGSPTEQEVACKAVLMKALKALEDEREAALKARAA